MLPLNLFLKMNLFKNKKGEACIYVIFGTKTKGSLPYL
jgi:hypothetical protein